MKYRIKILNPTMGVPISYLSVHNPEQFEIIGITAGRNEFGKESWPTKRYVNAIQHDRDGRWKPGSKANTGACIIVNNPQEVYYTADNTNGTLEIVYARILIRKKEEK